MHLLWNFAAAVSPRRNGRFRRLGERLLLAALLGAGEPLFAQTHTMPGPAPGLLESGSPQFAVLNPAEMGLTAPPTDIRPLPDGRLAALSGPQIAIGDGVRWETYLQVPGSPTPLGRTLAVDKDGTLYLAMPDGFGRVDFTDDGRWRLGFAAPWPTSERGNRPTPRTMVEVGDQWIWHSGSGSLISWRPGQAARTVGEADNVQTVFEFRGQLYLSDQTDAHVSRLVDGHTEPVIAPADISLRQTITCTLPMPDGRLLVGTHAEGLQVFDGRSITPVRAGGALVAQSRINDLCAAEGGYFAVAVENYGIVFFNADGRIVQTLDRTYDHRLGHVQRLLALPGGVIWGVLSDGLVRVAFPGRLSYFEPMIGTGTINAYPSRLNGRLWLAADGRVLRGVYDDTDRLVRLDPDTPPEHAVFSLTCDAGLPIAGTERGAYYRGPDGWVCFAPGTNNLRLLLHHPVDGRWLYGAEHELGWLRVTPRGVTIERIPTPQLNEAYDAQPDGTGRIWLELGVGRIGRITLLGERPVLETYDHHNGLPNGWAQVFVVDGKAGFNVADEILRFDEAGHRFEPDDAFARQFPGLHDIVGRPGLDAQGRLWIVANGGIHVLARDGKGWRDLGEKMPPGLQPVHLTFEEGGVVWLHAERHLVRYDPAMPIAADPPFRALISRVSLLSNGRSRFPLNDAMPALAYRDNSFVAYFFATANPFAAPVTFEVKLEGAETEWTRTGSANSAVFNRLKEGTYVLHVRPRSGERIGAEATLSFHVRPPWYRTPAAYAAYVLSAGLVLFGVGWLLSFMERRENRRLERLVAERTQELNASNDRLAAQVEEITLLSEAMVQSPVAVYITTPDGALRFANPRACELSGYSEAELRGRNVRLLRAPAAPENPVDDALATVGRGAAWRGELVNRHKSGRLLEVRSVIVPIRGPAGEIRHHLVMEEDITSARAEHEQRRRLEAQLFQAQKLESIGTLAGGVAHDFNNILTAIMGFTELANLMLDDRTAVQEHLAAVQSASRRAKDLVSQLLTFSRQAPMRLVSIELAEAVAEALKLIRASTPATVQIATTLDRAPMQGDATQVQQVVLNLCTNATHALPNQTGRIEVTVRTVTVTDAEAADTPDLWIGPAALLRVTDTGSGIEPSVLVRIFDPFFTTKAPGQGTGLGLSIVQGIVKHHHGAIRVRSRLGEGTTFDIYFPIAEANAAPEKETRVVPLGHNEEIMVVDDEQSVASFAATRLRHMGYRPVMYCDPAAALAAFNAEPLRFQAVVTDLTMPHLTGTTLIARLRDAGRTVPAVIITGYSSDSVQAGLTALPRCRTLLKPFSGDDLAIALHAVLHGGPVLA